MTFLNPLGWLLCLGLPILYLLSQNNKTLTKINVPTLDIWQQLYEESKQVKQKKLSSSLLMLLQMSLILCATLGMIDLYKTTFTEENLITIVYDNSLSMERITSKEVVKDFLTGHPKADYRIIFIDTQLHQEDSILSSTTALEKLLSRKASRNPLDYSLLEATCNKLLENNTSFVVFTDKKDLPLANIKTLAVDENNIGIREITYNPLEEILEITFENENPNAKLVPFEVAFNQELIMTDQLILDGKSQLKHEMNPRDFQVLKAHDSGLLTVRLAVEDSVSQDNTYDFPLIMSFDIHIENPHENTLKVVGLLPYAHVNSYGTALVPLTNKVSSTVTYSQEFLDYIQSDNLFSKDSMASPYFPLWIEDHIMASYNILLDKKIGELPLPLLPKNYINRDSNSFGDGLIKKPLKDIDPVYFMILFILLLIIEEEVRRRV